MGIAKYFTVNIHGHVIERFAWFYDNPNYPYNAAKNYITVSIDFLYNLK